MTGIEIGKVIKDKLTTIEALGGRLYPLIAENGTNYPFAVYEREGLNNTYCKDGIITDDVTVSIKVVTATYYQGVEIAEQVRKKLTFNYYKYDNNSIYSTLTSAIEYYQEEAYIQALTFNITITN